MLLFFFNFLLSVWLACGTAFEYCTVSSKKIKINTSGTLETEPLNCSNAHPQIKMQTSDLIIETYTKGLVLKNTNGNCFRITVNNTGNLQVLPLSSCP